MTQTVVVRQETNGLALAGFVFSCLGWLTCGALCIPGVLLSFLGLLGRPRGLAVAGLLVGLPGVLFFVLAGFAMVAAAIGVQAEMERIESQRQLTRPADSTTVSEL